MAATKGESSYWFARHSRSILVLIITLVLVGIYVAFTIPVSVFPDTNFPRILIAVDNGVMPIDQMMVTVTRPLEEAVNSVPGLQQVRSITSRGSAEIDLFFDWNVDMFQTLQYVNAALSNAQRDLPATAKVEAHRMTFASFPILGYSLTSETVPQTQLWELATYELKPRLNRLDGVASVIVQGGQEPEFHIVPDPARLLQASVTITDLLDAVQRTNLIDSPGLLERNHQLYLALISGQVRDPQQIAATVVKTTAAGVPVRVGDVAKVEPAVRPLYTVVSANGKPAVLLSINRQPASNTVQVADEVHAEVESLRKSLPPGVAIHPYYDQSDIVKQSIASVRDAILIGLILASIILVIFLRDWGTSIVAGLMIPATIALTFIVLKLMGESFNLMTLGGLAAAVGLVIDTAIVVVENIVLHRDAGQTRLQAIHSALAEITIPLIGSTITPIVVFLPLVSITGVTGTFFRALAVTMSVALLASLALALTWTPALSQFLIKRASGDSSDISDNLSDSRSDDKEDALDQVAPEPEVESIRRLMEAEEASLSGFFRKVINFHAGLEERVRVLGRAAQHRMVGRHRPGAMFGNQFVVNQRAQIGLRQHLNLLHLVRRAEAVEEMHERNPRPQRGRLRNQCEVRRFLHAGRTEHRPAGRAHGHDVAVIAENRKGMGRHRAGGDVEDCGQQLARDLEHVGNHQQQALRRREGGGHGTGLQHAMDRADGSAFTLQFHDGRDGAPEIFFAFGRPLIAELGHGR